MKRLTILEGSALLIGTQIGAGVLGLPYALKDGGIVGIALIVGVGFLTLATAIVVLKISKDIDGSMSRMARICLGPAWSVIMILSISILIYGAMIAYVSASGELLNSLVGLNKLAGSMIFWALLSGVVLAGLKFSGEVQVYLNFALLASLVAGAFMVAGRFDPKNLATFDLSVLVKGTGVVVFSYVSHMLVPEILRGTKDYKRTENIVRIGFFVPMIFYSVFILSFVGAFGKDTPEIATTVLSNMGTLGRVVGVLLPLVAMGTSYIGVSIAQMGNVEDLFSVNKLTAWILTVFPPLVVYLLGMKNFVKALWIGGTFGGIMYAGILPVMMYIKCCKEKDPRFSAWVYSSGLLFLFILIVSVLDLLG